jgi:hypothetical protein
MMPIDRLLGARNAFFDRRMGRISVIILRHTSVATPHSLQAALYSEYRDAIVDIVLQTFLYVDKLSVSLHAMNPEKRDRTAACAPFKPCTTVPWIAVCLADSQLQGPPQQSAMLDRGVELCKTIENRTKASQTLLGFGSIIRRWAGVTCEHFRVLGHVGVAADLIVVPRLIGDRVAHRPGVTARLYAACTGLGMFDFVGWDFLTVRGVDYF